MSPYKHPTPCGNTHEVRLDICPPSEPAGWGCACCTAVAFDPVPGVPALASRRAATRRQRGRQALCSVPCSAAGVEQARNIIAKGQRRFEIGSESPDQPDWEQLSSRVTCVLGQNPSDYTLNGTNCYLVGTGPRRLLVDAGDQHFGADAFMDVLAQCMTELNVEGLEGILVTHMHHDHYGNVGSLQAKYGPVPVYAMRSPEDQCDLLDRIRQRGLWEHFVDSSGMPRYNPTADLTYPSLPEDLDLKWAAREVETFPGSTVGSKMQYIFFFRWHASKMLHKLDSGDYPWHELRDGDRIHVEGATLVAMHTPGHAVDHMSYLLEEEHALFSGDHVLGWGTTLVFNMRDYMATLRRMLALKPTRLYPGHGGFIKEGVDLLSRYIEHREQREDQAWEALCRKSRPVQIMEIVEELYPNTSADRLWMAKDNVEKLFRKFAADGSASAWTTSTDANGTETLIPFEVPQSYSVNRLEDGLLWAARRNMTTLPRKGCHSRL